MSDQRFDAIIGGRVAGYERDQHEYGDVLSVIVEKDGHTFDVYAYDNEGRAPLYAEERDIILPSESALRHVRQLCEELAAASWPVGSSEWVEAAQITLNACLRLAASTSP